jgi:hypothetical protein
MRMSTNFIFSITLLITCHSAQNIRFCKLSTCDKLQTRPNHKPLWILDISEQFQNYGMKSQFAFSVLTFTMCGVVYRTGTVIKIPADDETHFLLAILEMIVVVQFLI